jgi:hypothetical protein
VHGLQQTYSDRVDFVILNFDDRTLDTERTRYNITDRSQYVLVDAADNVIHRWYVYISTQEIATVLDEFLAG